MWKAFTDGCAVLLLMGLLALGILLTIGWVILLFKLTVLGYHALGSICEFTYNFFVNIPIGQ